MLVYITTFYTLSPEGVRVFCLLAVEFFAGAVIPLPFFPEKIRYILELLPFAAMQNVPLRIYSGSMSGDEMLRAVARRCSGWRRWSRPGGACAGGRREG